MSLDDRAELLAFSQRMEGVGLTVHEIVKAMLSGNPLDWRVDAEIVPDWLPNRAISPNHTHHTKVVVRYRDEYLRHSHGPKQGFIWDCYPDDMKTVGLAFRALLEAPTPPGLWMPSAFGKDRNRVNTIPQEQADG